jgi:GT2 family glycosyltransferase
VTSDLPEISFVIPVRNDAVRLRHCLESLARDAAGVPHEIVVMDHGSNDGSLEVARRSGARAETRVGGNVAALRNDGAGLTAAPLIAFVDADHRVSPGWLSAALDALKDKGVAGAGAPYHAPADGTWVQRAYDGFRRHPSRTEPAEWFGAGNLVVRREVFEALGGFDDRLEACEDVDLCFRMRAAGWQLVSVPAMHSIHYGDPPTLKRLFLGELWRGRDNLRVSLRGPWSARNLASMAIPAVQLSSLLVLLAGFASGTATGIALALLALLAIAAPVVLRAATLIWNTRASHRVGPLAALLVAATFDAGRALALIARSGHHRRAPRSAATT